MNLEMPNNCQGQSKRTERRLVTNGGFTLHTVSVGDSLHLLVDVGVVSLGVSGSPPGFTFYPYGFNFSVPTSTTCCKPICAYDLHRSFSQQKGFHRVSQVGQRQAIHRSRRRLPFVHRSPWFPAPLSPLSSWPVQQRITIPFSTNQVEWLTRGPSQITETPIQTLRKIGVVVKRPLWRPEGQREGEGARVF